MVRYGFLSEKEEIRDSDQKNPIEVSCEQIPREDTMVVLIAGQSNSANSGESRYIPKKTAYNFYNGKCFEAKDPLLGASHDQGSVWSRFVDKVLHATNYESILLAPVSVGGSKISLWADRDKLGDRILSTSKLLNEINLPVTHIFWHQGEADAGLGISGYKNDLEKVISLMRENSKAPIYIAQTSRCGKIKGVQSLLDIQKSVVNGDDILAGPNTDKVGRAWRWDGCHFSTEGLDMVAGMWLKSILSNESSK